MARQGLHSTQRGVAAPVLAIAMLALVAALALAIDVARLYTAQRQLQSLADLAALDAARAASGCHVQNDANAEAQASLVRNRAPRTVMATVQTGTRQDNSGRWQFVPGSAGGGQSAVQVRLQQPTPARILPVFTGEASRTLRAQAAAFAGYASLLEPVYPLGTNGSGALLPTLQNLLSGGGGGGGGGLGGNVGVGLGSAGSVRIRLGDLVDESVDAGAPGSMLFEEMPVRGLLNQIADAIRATGNSALANSVDALASVTNASRQVIPGNVLGIPTGTPRALYEDATVGVDTLISGIANLAAQGINTPLPDLGLPPPLGDSSRNIRIDTPGNPALNTSATIDLGSGNVDSNNPNGGGGGASSPGARVNLGIGIAEPITGLRLTLPIAITPQSASASLQQLQCAQRGSALAEVRYQSSGGGVGLQIGSDSARFTLVSLDNLAGIPLPTAIRITAQSRSSQLDGGTAALCFTNQDLPTSQMCDGRIAMTPGPSSDEIARSFAQMGSTLDLQIEGLDTLPGGLLTARLQAAANQVLSSVQSQLGNVLSGLAPVLGPALTTSNLAAGGVMWRLNTLTTVQPVVFER